MDQESVLRQIALANVQGQMTEALRQAAALQCHRELLRATLTYAWDARAQAPIDGEQLARNAVALADWLMRALGHAR